jgi:hypothetical protein
MYCGTAFCPNPDEKLSQLYEVNVPQINSEFFHRQNVNYQLFLDTCMGIKKSSTRNPILLNKILID